MGQNESVAASRDHQTKRNDASSRQQPRPSQTQQQQPQQHSSNQPSSTSTSSSISTTRAPHGSLSLIKESPSPSPPTFLTTISQQFAEEDLESQFSNDVWSSASASSSSSTSNYKRSSLGISNSNSRTKHLVFEDGIEVSFEDSEESPPMTQSTKYNPIDISSLTSFKLDLSSSSTLPTASSRNNAESSSLQSGDLIEDGCIVHFIKKNDTLQGIALTYRVKVEDIKTKNKLWNKNDLFARKKLLIPLAAQAQAQTQTQPSIGSSSSTSSVSITPSYSNSPQSSVGISRSGEALSSEDTDRHHLTARFMRDLKTSVEIAIHYLERSNWNYSEAVDSYIDDIRNNVIVAPAPRETKKKKPLGEVAKLRTSQQKAFNKIEDDIYEL